MGEGVVENQVGNLRDQLFRPKPRVKSLADPISYVRDRARLE
jgi:hypothetical protein